MHPRVGDILRSIESAAPVLPPTQLYNEGWMLRLLLDWAQRSAPSAHPLALAPGARWFSEGLLPSQFLPERRGDPLAESHTHADAIIGHFTVGESAKGDVALAAHAVQFGVTEAKMFSGLSSGTKNAPGFDQAARNVACVAEILARAGRTPNSLHSLFFYVLAPREQIDAGVFAEQMNRDAISNNVQKRVAAYAGRKDAWLQQSFLPTLERIKLAVLSWEEFVDQAGSEYQEFYAACLRFNCPPTL